MSSDARLHPSGGGGDRVQTVHLAPTPHVGELVVGRRHRPLGTAFTAPRTWNDITVLSEDGRELASIRSSIGVWLAMHWADQVIAADMLDRGLPISMLAAPTGGGRASG